MSQIHTWGGRTLIRFVVVLGLCLVWPTPSQSTARPQSSSSSVFIPLTSQAFLPSIAAFCVNPYGAQQRQAPPHPAAMAEDDSTPREGFPYYPNMCLLGGYSYEVKVVGSIDSASVPEVVWSADGQYLRYGVRYNVIRIFERATKKTYEFPYSASAWSSVGHRIAYSSKKNDTLVLSISEPDGSGKIDLDIGEDSYILSMYWSPDNTKIFVGGNLNVYIVQLSDMSIHRYGKSNDNSWFFNGWSPDGKRFLYVDNMLGRLYVLDTEDSSTKYIIDLSGFSSDDLWWIEDSSSFVYMNHNYMCKIKVTDLNCNVILFPMFGSKINSPSGKYALYIAKSEEVYPKTRDVFVVDINTMEKVKIDNINSYYGDVRNTYSLRFVWSQDESSVLKMDPHSKAITRIPLDQNTSPEIIFQNYRELIGAEYVYEDRLIIKADEQPGSMSMDLLAISPDGSQVQYVTTVSLDFFW